MNTRFRNVISFEGKHYMDWYSEDVKGTIEQRNRCAYAPETIFYGSSTIRLWETLYEDFKAYKPVNLGFGGSTLAACVWFFEQIVSPIEHPKRMIFYAGDNDLGDGRHPEEVFLFYKEMVAKFRSKYPHVPFYFISIKPSVKRADILDKIVHTNALIKGEILKNGRNEFYVNIFDEMINKKGKPIRGFFDADGLHLDKKGYAIWKKTILEECFKADEQSN